MPGFRALFAVVLVEVFVETFFAIAVKHPLAA